MQPDFAKIDQNLKVLADKGAPEADVKAYLEAEGVTAQQVLDGTKSFARKAVDAIASAGGAVVDAVRGKHDPKFADVPGFSFQGLNDIPTMSQIARGKTVTYEDQSYGDIVKKALGERLQKTERDANGYEVLTYKGDDEQTYRVYTNKPGLDWQDVDRGVSGAAPFILGGGVAGRIATKLGGGVVARVGAQSTGAAATSLAADTVAQNMGSEQPHDLTRAGVAAATSGLFEALSGPVASLWQRIFGNPTLVKDGKLTAPARVEAQRMGIDPDVLDRQVAKEWAKDTSRAADPVEVGTKYRTDEFGIPTTKGTRTKDPAMLGPEEEMRRGLMGEEAQRIMRDHDKRVVTSIDDAVNNKIGGDIAPNAPGREPATLGGDIRTATRDVRGNLRQAENQVWDETGPMFPKEEGWPILRQNMAAKLQRENALPNPNLGRDPVSNDMLQFLDDYATGKLGEQVRPLIGKGESSIFIDDVRRRLLAQTRDAVPGSNDARIAKHIYDGFNEWIGELADKALIVGKPDVHAKLVSARAFTQEVKQLFEPGSAATPAAKRIAKVMDENASPEEVLTALFGAGGPTSKIQQGETQALANMKTILTEHGQKDAWDNVRLAYWTRIAQDNKGKVLSPGVLKNNIDAAFHNQRSVLNILYGQDEQAVMKRFATALEDVTYKPPNASGTSYELKRMQQASSGDGALKTLLQTQSKRELFSKHNVLMSRIYAMLAKKLPISPFGTKEALGSAAARRATSEEITLLPPSSYGLGGAVGAEASE